MGKSRTKKKAKRLKACPSGKVPYDTRESAYFFLDADLVTGRVYLCNFCNKYHLTSQPKREYRKRQNEG